MIEPIQTQEYILRAMARNYGDGPHSWDHLDKEVCAKAADEIKSLRAANNTFADNAIARPGAAQSPGLREALEKIAKQKTQQEWESEFGEEFSGDYGAGYDSIIGIARNAIGHPVAVEASQKSAPLVRGPHNSGEPLPNGDTAAGGADTVAVEADQESQAKATEGKAGMAVGQAHVRRSTAGTGLQVGEADAVQPATSEIMDVTDRRDGHPSPVAVEQPTSPAVDGLREAVALEIWHRFANSGTEEWKDETHKAEYLLCADSILALTSRVSAPVAWHYLRATATTSSGKPALWQNELTFGKPDTHEFIKDVRPLYAAPSPALDPATVERCYQVVLEERCERGTPWDLACTTIARKIMGLIGREERAPADAALTSRVSAPVAASPVSSTERAEQSVARKALDGLADKVSAKISQLTYYRDEDCQLEHARTIAEGRILQANQILHWIAEVALQHGTVSQTSTTCPWCGGKDGKHEMVCRSPPQPVSSNVRAEK